MFTCKAANVACYMKLRLNDEVWTLKGLHMDILCGLGMKWHMIVALHRCSHMQLLQKQFLIFLDSTVFQQLNRHAKLLYLRN